MQKKKTKNKWKSDRNYLSWASDLLWRQDIETKKENYLSVIKVKFLSETTQWSFL